MINKIIFFLLVTHGIGFSVFSQINLALYPDSTSKVIGKNNVIPTMTAYLPSKEKATGTGVLIFPGGGYGFLATETEGTPIAEAFVQKGIAAFVIKYRLPQQTNLPDKSMGPLIDAQQAIKIVRDSASSWHLENNKIGVIGFSAGGHLASSLGVHYDTSYIPNEHKINLRPDFMLLIYPVISMKKKITHVGSRINLIGSQATAEKVKFFSSEDNVNSRTPPTYITHTGDDQIVDVENSIQMYQWLQIVGVDAELHIYPRGNHGFIQRQPVNEWLNPILDFLKKEKLYREFQ
ncbi:alpha/beta hydrolase [Niastella sp. OAS944]|uniref:alpha/beta hydrolase n=1 Tax=Niastella sp. OAS944 TaxID=2664089 RepID=UPI003478E406|nr:acetyl esterase/lipase [Chitinophagaceae bacterium OAS944]